MVVYVVVCSVQLACSLKRHVMHHRCAHSWGSNLILHLSAYVGFAALDRLRSRLRLSYVVGCHFSRSLVIARLLSRRLGRSWGAFVCDPLFSGRQLSGGSISSRSRLSGGSSRTSRCGRSSRSGSGRSGCGLCKEEVILLFGVDVSKLKGLHESVGRCESQQEQECCKSYFHILVDILFVPRYLCES